jgi:glycoprotein 2-beta-D-xylosyltransferase
MSLLPYPPRYVPMGSSSDPSKYGKLPRSLQERLSWLQRVGCFALVLLALILLGGDGALIWRSGGLRRGVEKAVAAPGGKGYLLSPRGRAPGSSAAGGGEGEGEGRGLVVDSPKVEQAQPSAVAEDALEVEEEAEEPLGELPPSEEVEEEPEAAADGEEATVEAPASWEADEPDSCGGYFGNGFADVTTVLPASGESEGEAILECRVHPATSASICFGRNMLLRSDRIQMSEGGEDLQAVMGRREDDEQPDFTPAALEFVTKGYSEIPLKAAASFMGGDEEGGVSIEGKVSESLLPRIQQHDKFKAAMLRTTVAVDASANARTCAVRVIEPVLFLTRMEYANLFHTSTDWYNTWSAARLAGLAPTTSYGKLLRKLTPRSLVAPNDNAPRFAAHVVFLDGHNAGPMDDGWTALFLSASYAKHFTGPACFDRPILAPFGCVLPPGTLYEETAHSLTPPPPCRYNAAISMGLVPKQLACASSPHVRAFGNDFVRGLGLAPRATSACTPEEHARGGAAGSHAGDGEPAPIPVLFVRRVDYLAHPRHDGKIVRRLDNEDDITEALNRAAARSGASISLLPGLFSSMTLREQVEAAQDACLITGAHGAGLTHVLFAPPGVHMLELQPPAFMRPHFIGYSTWTGARHHLWTLGTTQPDVGEVVMRITRSAEEAAVAEADAAERAAGHGGLGRGG